MENIVKSYLACLESADLETLLSLFAADAKVVSPLYGTQSATFFYKKLFEDTTTSKITLLDIFTKEKKASVHFLYEWQLANGEHTIFEVVDILEFDANHKISSLKIFYDTANTRKKWEEPLKQG